MGLQLATRLRNTAASASAAAAALTQWLVDHNNICNTLEMLYAFANDSLHTYFHRVS